MKMWRVWIAAGVVLWGGPCLLWADLVIVQKVEESGSKRPPAEVLLKIKGDKIRADLSPAISILMDTATGDTTTLCHDRKTCLVLTGATARKLQEEIRRFQKDIPPTAEAAPVPPSPLVSTGKYEAIGGRETEIFTAESGSLKVTWWVAKKGGDWEKYLPQLAPLQRAPMVQLAAGLALPGVELPGLAVKTELNTPDGRRIVTTLLAIREEPLENVDFAIPPGYRSLAEPLFGPP